MSRYKIWHVSFAHIPDPVPAPGNGQVIGVDRGVAVSAALSTGEMLTVPGLSQGEQRRLGHLERTLARARKGSNRRGTVKTAIAKLKAREAGRRKDWCEKLSASLARRSATGTIAEPGRNVAAGRAVTARGGHRDAGPVNREPQLLLQSV